MAAALIALIIFLFIGLCQNGDLAQREIDKKNSTRTNVKLERKLFEIYSDQIDAELDRIQETNEGADAWEAVDALYSFHNIPKETIFEILNPSSYHEEENKFGRTKPHFWVEQKEKYDIDSRRTLKYLEVSQHSVGWREEDINRWFIKARKKFDYPEELDCEYKADIERLFPNGEKTEYNEDSYIYLMNKYLYDYSDPVHMYPYLKGEYAKNLDEYNRVLSAQRFSGASKEFEGIKKYRKNLIELMVQRTLSNHGFHLSQDGLHDSPWQEEQKNKQSIQDYKEKYPWMFK